MKKLCLQIFARAGWLRQALLREGAGKTALFLFKK
jgi:hypothetical protein